MEKAVVIWQGRTRPVEFSYQDFNGDKTRRLVDVTKVLYDSSKDRTYLQGFCSLRKEDRSFNTRNITTMLKVGSKRYEVWEWFDDCLGIAPPWRSRDFFSNSYENKSPNDEAHESHTGSITISSDNIKKVAVQPPSILQRLEEHNKKQEQRLAELKEKHRADKSNNRNNQNIESSTYQAKDLNRDVGVLLGIGIFLLPLIFSWFTLRRGHSLQSRLASFAWLLFLIVASTLNKS